MDRRNFVVASAALGVGAMSGLPVAAMAPPKNLLSAPDMCVGGLYTLSDGTKLVLRTVDPVGVAGEFSQWHAQFESSAELREGVYELCSANAMPVSLFLQCTNNIASASIARRR